MLVAREKGKVIQEIRVRETNQINLFGNVRPTTQAIQTLCEAGIPIDYFSMSGWFYGFTNGMLTQNVFRRRAQYRMADAEWFSLMLSRELISGKIRNQRVLLQRNHIEPNPARSIKSTSSPRKQRKQKASRNCSASKKTPPASTLGPFPASGRFVLA